MFWLFGQIWIWLIIAFALGAISAALVSSGIHTRNNQDRSTPLETDHAEDFDTNRHQDDLYAPEGFEDDVHSGQSGRPSEIVDPTEETTILKAHPDQTGWPAEEFDRPTPPSAVEPTRTDDWPGQAEPQWPTAEDWPDGNQQRRHW